MARRKRSIDVPNLDDSPPSVVRAFRRRMNRLTSEQSSSILGDPRAASQLAKYCNLTLSARRARIAGSIRRAAADESLRDSVYSSLPASLKW